MTISSWDAVYYLGISIGMDRDDIYEISQLIVPDDDGKKHDLDSFVMDSVVGLDKKSLVIGAMVSSIIMNRLNISTGNDGEVVKCIVCGNQNPVSTSVDEELGWVCSDCMDAYNTMKRRIENERVEKHGIVSNLWVIACYNAKNIWRNVR